MLHLFSLGMTVNTLAFTFTHQSCIKVFFDPQLFLHSDMVRACKQLMVTQSPSSSLDLIILWS